MSNLIHSDNKDLPKIALREIIRSIPLIDKRLETFFIGEDREKLNEILAKLSFHDINHLLESIFSFFDHRVPIDSITLPEIEKIDFKRLAYDFANQLDLQVPLAVNEKERKECLEILLKLGRVFLHEIAFPMIVAEDVRIAVSAKNLVKRTIASVCVVEGVNKNEVFEMLKLDELPVEIPIGYLPQFNKQEEKESLDNNKEEFSSSPILVCHLSDERKMYLSLLLKEQHGVFTRWKPFYDLMASYGKCSPLVIVKPEKIRLLLRVIYSLYEKRTPTHKRFLSLNKEKGLWEFLQQYIINAKTDNVFDRELRKISSETNKDREFENFRLEAETILDEVFKIENDKLIKIISKENDC